MKPFLFVCAALALSSTSAQTPESLRAHLSYLASDELEGRATPSHGLDLAADYIADQFRKANLNPATPGGSYFQTANFEEATTNFDGFALTLKSGTQQISVSTNDVRIRSLIALDFRDAPVLREPAPGQVVAADSRRPVAELQARHPALILVYGPPVRTPTRPFLHDADSPDAPVVRISSPDAIALFRSGRPVSLSLHLAVPSLKETPLRNVAAILPGSDPVLRNQYVLLTAHYDHLGKTPQGIFNGANDDASGVASVIEIAHALAQTSPRPKRSILFMAFFGEELGLLGSAYYVQHPLVPLKDTIADINLEQLGRTDETSGREIAAFAFTGPGYTNLPALMTGPARAEGVRVYGQPGADSYFARSDNYSFAQHGVVDTTIAVAFDYPEYHKIGDTVEKIDFANLAKVDRAIAAGVVRLADESGVPKWRASHPLKEGVR